MAKTKTNLDKVGKFVDRKGQIVGEVRIVHGWHALGCDVSVHLSHHLFYCTHVNSEFG